MNRIVCAVFFYSEVLLLSDSDVIYINSCTVTAEGAAKSRFALRKARRKSPNSIIVFGGCLPQIESATTDFSSMGADIVVGNTDRAGAVELVENLLTTRSISAVDVNDGLSLTKVHVKPHRSDDRFELLPFGGDGHTRAFLKVQDGCPRSCSYCIVSKARGSSRSAEEAAIVEGAKSLVQSGHREIVLCGINLSYYGADTASSLGQLCAKLDRIDGLERIRLGSLEPDMLGDKFCNNLAECKKLSPHFHLSLQSGSDKILRDMNRFYNRSEFLEIVERLRYYFDFPTFTTDIMVGYPGESQQDFQDTLRMVDEVGFLKVHVFRYSRREGTVAFDLPGQLPGDVKKHRAGQLLARAELARNATLESLMNLPDSFIAQKKNPNGAFEGMTGRYVHCEVRNDSLSLGDCTTILLSEATILSDHSNN